MRPHRCKARPFKKDDGPVPIVVPIAPTIAMAISKIIAIVFVCY